MRKFILGKKIIEYFIGYKDNQKVKPLCLLLPKVSGYAISLDETKSMSFFLLKNNELLKIFIKYGVTWETVLKENFRASQNKKKNIKNQYMFSWQQNA